MDSAGSQRRALKWGFLHDTDFLINPKKYNEYNKYRERDAVVTHET